MKINFYGETTEVMQGICLLSERLDFEVANEGKLVKIMKTECGLCVKHEGTGYFIEYSEKAEFFRCLSILLDKIRKNVVDFSICEVKKFNTCGIQLDVSRNAVMKISTIKDITQRMALMGLNLIMLYAEDVYKMEKYPYFGYMRGAYSKDELKEMVEYANIFGIEMVPSIQTLSHLETTLRWSYANDMKDTDSVLLVDEQKTYEFIEEMIKTISGCFTSKKIHIGMDEAHGVGFGNFFLRHGYENRFNVLSRHLNRVMEIIKKYNLEPMMWSDMFFRLGSKTNSYYDTDAAMPDNITTLIPNDISMVYWDYYHEDELIYDKMIEIHKKMEQDIIFAGCIWTANTLALNYGKTFETTKAALSSCGKNNIKNVYACIWGDDGSESSIYSALLGFQLYAEYNYYDDISDEHLKNMFKICTGYDMDAFLLFDIDKFDIDITGGIRSITISKQVLYQDVLQGLFDKSFAGIDLKSHYKSVAEKLSQIGDQGDLNYLFIYLKQLVKVVYEKCDVGIRLINSYENNNREEMFNIVEELKIIKGDLGKFIKTLSDIWYKNNKAFGFDRLDLRFGGVMARIDRAIIRIMRYLNGEIINIEELEEKRLIYNGIENPFAYRTFSDKYLTVSHPQ